MIQYNTYYNTNEPSASESVIKLKPLPHSSSLEAPEQIPTDGWFQVPEDLVGLVTAD